MIIFNNLQDLGLLALRIAIGSIFIYHGLPKLKKPKAMEQMFGNIWFPFLIGLGEFAGGLAAILGFYTEIAGLIFVILMLGALYFKLLTSKAPFSSMKKLGWEFDLILLGGALALLFIGAGNISIDAVIGLWP